MGTFNRKGDIPIRSDMSLSGIVISRPERAFIHVSMQLNNDSYWSERGQGWEPQLLARLDRNNSLALSIQKTSTVDRLAIDLQKKLGVLDQFANLYYAPSDGFSPHDAHADGQGYDSAPHSLISLMTPEYEPPDFQHSNGLCYILSRKASM
eukprot:1068423-Pleurochrysis_carterae.AAC.1